MSTDKQRPLVKSPASFHEAVSEFLPVEAIGREAKKLMAKPGAEEPEGYP